MDSDIVARRRPSRSTRHRKGADLRARDIEEREGARILGLVEEGVKAGAKLELDGRNIKVPGYESGNFIGPTNFFRREARDVDLFDEIFGRGDGHRRREYAGRGAFRLVQTTMPFGNGTRGGIFTQRAPRPQIQKRNRRGQVGINVPIPVPVPILQLHRVARSKSARCRIGVRQAVGAVLHPDEDVTSRWFEDGAVSTGSTPRSASSDGRMRIASSQELGAINDRMQRRRTCPPCVILNNPSPTPHCGGTRRGLRTRCASCNADMEIYASRGHRPRRQILQRGADLKSFADGNKPEARRIGPAVTGRRSRRCRNRGP